MIPACSKSGLARLGLLVEDLLEEAMVGLGDRVLGAEPEVALFAERVVDAGPREAADGLLGVVHAHDHAGPLELVHSERDRSPPPAGVNTSSALPGAGHLVLDRLVDVAVGVPADDDRLFPAPHRRRDVLHDDRLAEDRAVEDRADRAVRALPCLLEVVLLHPRRVRRDGRALDAHAVLDDGIRRVDGDLVVGLVAVLDAEVVVFEVHRRDGAGAACP